MTPDNVKTEITLAPALAVDFDGCLCFNNWPDIGAPNYAAIAAVRARKAQGWKIILWTCRVGDALDAAVGWCAEHGLTFDAVNENLPERIALYASDSRKVSADEYWDDRAIRLNAGEVTHAVLD